VVAADIAKPIQPAPVTPKAPCEFKKESLPPKLDKALDNVPVAYINVTAPVATLAKASPADPAPEVSSVNASPADYAD